MDRIDAERERAKAYADFQQFRLGKGLESKEYLNYMLLYLEQYVNDLKLSLKNRTN